MAVAGLRGTGDWGTDERPKNFREMILWLNPNGTAPIFALSSRASKQSTDDPEFNWWCEPNDQIRLKVTFGGGYGTTETSLTVFGTEPSSSALDVNWGSALSLKPGDLLLVEPSVEAAAFTHEILLVTGVGSATVLNVQRAFAGTSAAAIADNAFLLKIGSAYGEGTSAPIATSRNPVKYTNKCQIFKDSYSITGTAEQTHVRTGDPIKNDKKRKAFDHAASIEYALLFGKQSESTGANGKPLRTMDGLRRFISSTTTTVWTSGKNLNNLIDAVSPVFNYDSDAGDTRMAFCGNGTLNAINKAIANASGQAAMNIMMNNGTKVYGVNFTEMVFPQGRILLKTHPLFNRNSLFTNSMLIMDFSSFKWRPMKNRDTKFTDDIQTKREDLREGMWMTEAGIEVWAGGLTCGWVGGFNNLT